MINESSISYKTLKGRHISLKEILKTLSTLPKWFSKREANKLLRATYGTQPEYALYQELVVNNLLAEKIISPKKRTGNRKHLYSIQIDMCSDEITEPYNYSLLSEMRIGTPIMLSGDTNVAGFVSGFEAKVSTESNLDFIVSLSTVKPGGGVSPRMFQFDTNNFTSFDPLIGKRDYKRILAGFSEDILAGEFGNATIKDVLYDLAEKYPSGFTGQSSSKYLSKKYGEHFIYIQNGEGILNELQQNNLLIPSVAGNNRGKRYTYHVSPEFLSMDKLDDVGMGDIILLYGKGREAMGYVCRVSPDDVVLSLSDTLKNEYRTICSRKDFPYKSIVKKKE